MYKFLGLHFKHWLLILWPLAFLLRTRLFPKSLTKETLEERIQNKSVIYIISRMSILDIFILNRALKKLKQRPIKTEANLKTNWISSVLALKAPMFFKHDDKEIFVKNILSLLKADASKTKRHFIFMPVGIYWSRAAERNEKGFVLKSLFPDDGNVNFLQKLFMLILHRGEVNISFGKEIEVYLPPSEPKTLSPEEQQVNYNLDLMYARRLRRQLYIEFAKERTSLVGPTLYDLDKITQWILASDQTKNFLMHNEHPDRTKRQIQKYIKEIAANYRYSTLLAVEQLFDFIWNKVFTGIRVRNFDKVERLARENCVIWMPSHRSHFDYLLLNYLLFKQGFIVPHVAAGSNLNFWPIGAIIRTGGGFFIRRSFSGNKTYTHTFSEYVNFLMHNSYPVEFFPEGGRSRVGKLLTPKLGMLSISLQSMIQRKSENTFLMPVSIGYDKVMEDDSYAKELKGAKKQKENVLQFLNGVRKVFANYGSVDVSFGEPVLIAQAWDLYTEKYAKKTGRQFEFKKFIDIPKDIDTRDPKIQAFVKFLAYRVHQKINGAATASSTALLSTVLIAEKINKISSRSLVLYMLILHDTVNELGQKLGWNIATAKSVENVFEYIQENLPITQNDETEVVSHGASVKIQKLGSEYLQMGKTWHLLKEEKEHSNIFYIKNIEKEFNLWWYRGTTFHIFAIVGVLAHGMLVCKITSISELERLFDSIRNLWRDELFWDDDTDSKALLEAAISVLRKLHVVECHENNIQIKRASNISEDDQFSPTQILKFFAHTIRPEIELYGLILSVSLYCSREKNYLERGEVIDKTLSIHDAAYKQNLTTHPSTFTKVFGNSIFDAFSRQNIFVATERRRFTVDMLLVSGLTDFFNLNKWKNFLR